MKKILIILAAIALTSCTVFKGVVPGEQYKVYDVYLNNPNVYTYKYKVEVYLVKNPNANNTYFMTNREYEPGDLVSFEVLPKQSKFE